MVALQIRDVPDDLRDKLAAIAGERGQSLQAYLFDVIKDEVRRRDNLAVLQRFSGTSYGTSLTNRDVLDVLSGERSGRDRRLGTPDVPEVPE
ncbi:hypothetical protein [Streptomyces sp. NBC_01198]|uniref:hypothetical protein n=1 Tax=Streptomyces sp. NBC_01198 TaxID=2903769 RepID=UPI002E14A5C0|nr:hypothetical protein OG702_17575 [Streptomyces sp. NBC_01198]